MRMRMRMQDIYYDIVCINKSYSIVNSVLQAFSYGPRFSSIGMGELFPSTLFFFLFFLLFSSPA